MESKYFFLFCALLFPFFFASASVAGIRTKLLSLSNRAKTSLNVDLGIPWRSPLAVIKYFKPFYKNRNYCEIGLRDSTLLFNVAKHASKAIGIEKDPWGCRLAQNKLKAMEKSGFPHNVQIMCRDAFVGDFPEADFYYLWIGDCKLYSLALPNTGSVGANISSTDYVYFRRDPPCNSSFLFGYCEDYMKNSSLWVEGHQPMPNHTVMPILNERGKRFFFEKYGRHFEAIGIPYDERTTKEKTNTDAIKYRTSWDSYVIGYPKHGYWTVFFSKASESCDLK